MTPLVYACGGGHVDVIRTLLKTGRARVNETNPQVRVVGHFALFWGRWVWWCVMGVGRTEW